MTPNPELDELSDEYILDQIRRSDRIDTDAPGLLRRGLGGSTTGILTGQGLSLEEQELAEAYKERNPNWIRDGVETLVNMTASLPTFWAGGKAGGLAGGAIGSAAGGPVGGLVGAGIGSASGGFALDTAIREIYQHYLGAVKRGETGLSFEDWVEVAKETGKSGALGAALGIASPYLSALTRSPSVKKLLSTPLTKRAADIALEAGAFTVGGAAVGHGDLSFESFRDNLIAVGGMHLSSSAYRKMYNEYKKTGKPPEQLLIEYKPNEGVITPEATPEQLRRARVRGRSQTEEELFPKLRRSEEPIDLPPRDYGFGEGFGEGLERLSNFESQRRAANKNERKGIGYSPRQEIEYKPSAVTPITEAQRADAERIGKRRKPFSKKSESEIFKDLPKKHAEEVELKRIEKGIKEIEAKEAQEKKSRAESERAELERIEEGIRELERKEAAEKAESKIQEERDLAEQLKRDLKERTDALKKRKKDLKALEQSELYKKAVRLRNRLEKQAKDRAHLEKLRAQEKKLSEREMARKKAEKVAPEAIAEPARQEEAKRQAKVDADRAFAEQLRADAEARVQELKQRHKELSKQKRSPEYQEALKQKQRREKLERDRAYTEEVRKKEVKAAEEGLRKYTLANKMKEIAKKKKEASDLESTRLREQQAYETERQMNTPLETRIGEAVAEREGMVRQLKKDLMKSYQAKDPIAVKEKIKRKIEGHESAIRELRAAEKARENISIEDELKAAGRKRATPKFIESVNRAADKTAEAILSKVEKTPAKNKLWDSIKNDLKTMDITLRCL